MAKRKRSRDDRGRYAPSKRTKNYAGGVATAAAWGAGEAAAALSAATAISYGYDLVKGPSGNFRHTNKTKPTQLAHGWYVDTMSGLQHKIHDNMKPVISTAGRKTDYEQTSLMQDTILNRIQQQMIFNDWPLTEILGASPAQSNTRALITTSRQKVMWTNLSNVKICYEYYLVTPKSDMSGDFQGELTNLSNILDSASGGHDVLTIWRPETLPALMKNWRVLSKSVFRLAPGETAELHSKSNIYRWVDEGLKRDRSYIEGLNTQLYCRWYGCPTAKRIVATGVVPSTGGTFSDNVLHTSWIIERSKNYYQTDVANPTQAAWITSVQPLLAGEEIVTHAQTDDDVTPAE